MESVKIYRDRRAFLFKNIKNIIFLEVKKLIFNVVNFKIVEYIHQIISEKQIKSLSYFKTGQRMNFGLCKRKQFH